jgi:hypothetical protein
LLIENRFLLLIAEASGLLLVFPRRPPLIIKVSFTNVKAQAITSRQRIKEALLSNKIEQRKPLRI